MIELTWTRSTPTCSHCNWGKYFLKKKTEGGRERYEVWRGETLLENCLTYWELLARLDYKFKRAD